MRRVKVTLPATVTNLGPGLNSLGLAIGLHASIEFTDRADTQLVVETTGEGSGQYATGLRHPVVLGMMRVFQHFERAPLGLSIRIDNKIPLNSGLGGDIAFLIAGVIAANNLIGGPLKRDPLLRFAVDVSRRADHAVTAILGGLTATVLEGESLTYARLPLEAMQAVLVVPDLPDYAQSRLAVAQRAPLVDALHNLSRLPLLLDALRRGDFDMLAQGLDDKLIAPARLAQIPGAKTVIDAAVQNGASGVVLCGTGPAMLAFAPRDHRTIADEMRRAFADHRVEARTWIVPVDTQGLVLSAARSG